MAQRQIDGVALAKLRQASELALLVQNGHQQLVAQPFRTAGFQAERGGEDAGLVLSFRVRRAQALIAQLRQIDECLLGEREFHFQQRVKAESAAASRFPSR